MVLSISAARVDRAWRTLWAGRTPSIGLVAAIFRSRIIARNCPSTFYDIAGKQVLRVAFAEFIGHFKGGLSLNTALDAKRVLLSGSHLVFKDDRQGEHLSAVHHQVAVPQKTRFNVRALRRLDF